MLVRLSVCLNHIKGTITIIIIIQLSPKIVDFAPKFQVKGIASTNHICTDSLANECLTTFSLTVFTQRNFVADFLQAKCDFTPKTAVCVFEPPFGGGGLGASYNDHRQYVIVDRLGAFFY